VYVLVAFFEHGVLPPNGHFLHNTGRQNNKKGGKKEENLPTATSPHRSVPVIAVV